MCFKVLSKYERLKRGSWVKGSHDNDFNNNTNPSNVLEVKSMLHCILYMYSATEVRSQPLCPVLYLEFLCKKNMT